MKIIQLYVYAIYKQGVAEYKQLAAIFRIDLARMVSVCMTITEYG